MSSPTSALLRLVTTSAVSYFIPPLLVQGALAIIYRTFPRLQPSAKHAQLAHYAIIWIYAAYMVLSSYADLPVSYYDLLGISPPLGALSDGVDRWKDTVLRSRWLSLVRVYHPDKSGGSEEAHALFRGLQQANEVLKSDLLRHAYERFGPAFLERTPMEKMRTEREVLLLGALSTIGWYLVSASIFVIIPALSSRPNKKLFWRFASLLLLFANELALISSTTTAYSVLGFHHLLTYEITSILRQAWVAFNVILSHLPYLDEPKPSSIVTSKLGPLLSSVSLRSDISSITLDNVIRKEFQSSGTDKEAHIAGIVEKLG